MSNQLMKFESPELGMSLSGVLYQGKPVFDAVALAKSLGYANPADALKKHCKSLIKLNYSESRELGFGNNPRGIQLAGQADLFRLILRSQLLSAERVQDWVCEEVLPSIMATGSYSKEEPEQQQKVITMNNDLLSLARVVAEATASATMKAVFDIAGIPAFQGIKTAEPVAITSEPTTTLFNAGEPHHEPDINQAVFVPVSDLSWACGLSDAACRRLATFAKLQTCMSNGDRGYLLIHRESFMTAGQALLDESMPPTGNRKRWQHPRFGGFTLRLKSTDRIKGE